MNIEIEFDNDTGDIFLNRDDEIMLEMARLLSDNVEDFEKFFEDKPLNIDGDKNYNSFCG